MRVAGKQIKRRPREGKQHTQGAPGAPKEVLQARNLNRKHSRRLAGEEAAQEQDRHRRPRQSQRSSSSRRSPKEAGRPRKQARPRRTSPLSLLRHRNQQPGEARRAAGQERPRTMPLSLFRNSSLQLRQAREAAGLGRPRRRLQNRRRRLPRRPKEASAPAACSPQRRLRRLKMQVPEPRSGSCAPLSRSEQLQ